jgi:hypothetical protein
MARKGPTGAMTDERVERILTAIRAANYLEVSAHLGGVTGRTVRRWIERGRRESAGPYHDFAQRYAAALAEGEDALLRKIQAAASNPGPGTWQAASWILERRHPQRWSRPELNLRVKHEGVVHVEQSTFDKRFGAALRQRQAQEIPPSFSPSLPAPGPPSASDEREALPTDEERLRRAGLVPARQITGTVPWAGRPLWSVYEPPPRRDPRPDSSATAGLMKRDF